MEHKTTTSSLIKDLSDAWKQLNDRSTETDDGIWCGVAEHSVVDYLIYELGERVESESPWKDVEQQLPDKSGRYLVTQRLNRIKAYRWVRYFHIDDGWYDVRPETYGEVTHWCEMPPIINHRSLS